MESHTALRCWICRDLLAIAPRPWGVVARADNRDVPAGSFAIVCDRCGAKWELAPAKERAA